LRKLRQFQDLSHEVYFLIGDFTGRIGDPSGRSEIRKQLTKKEVAKNAKTYKKQVAKVLDIRKLKIVFNSKWFDRMHGLEFGKLLTHYTANRLLEREDFTQRRNNKKPIFMSEFIYPILQGYDSVMLKADVEIGGTDQIFNLLVGRDLQNDFKQPQQVVLTMPLLEGTDGIQKMSKSYANYIGINEPAKNMFGKIMSVSDELMIKYYELLTDENMDSVRKMHPKEAKVKLAKIIIAQYHSPEAAEKEAEEFRRVFSQKEVPSTIVSVQTTGTTTIKTMLIDKKLVSSGNELRRLIREGAVSFGNQKIEKDDFMPKCTDILRVGSRRFLKVEYKEK